MGKVRSRPPPSPSPASLQKSGCDAYYIGTLTVSFPVLPEHAREIQTFTRVYAGFRQDVQLSTTFCVPTELSSVSLTSSKATPILPGVCMRVVQRSLPALLVVTVLSIPSFSATPDRIAGALNSGQTITLRGSVNRKALPKYDVGPADPALRFGSIMLLTSPTAAQQQAMTQLLAEQQDRKSSNYHRWLTPEQFADRFGLSPNDVQKITNWLGDHGFTGIQVARGRNWFVFSGTATQIQSAFGAEIHRYNVNGEMHVANSTAPKVPAGLAGIVTGIRGLDDFYLKPRAVHSVRPNYYDSSLGASYLAPGDIATIYDINALYSSAIDGTGQKIAIIGQTDIYLSDINDFRTGFGLSSITCTTNSSGLITACNDPHLQYVVPTGVEDPQSPSPGDLSEADLDLEIAGAVARNAQLIFVNTPFNTTTPSSDGVWESWYYAVDQNLASVISMSYGLCEFGDPYIGNNAESGSDEYELYQANLEGITFVNSSGDSGAAECDPDPLDDNNTDLSGASATGGYAVSYPASSPEVTAVGGNSISLANLASTTYWGTNNGSGGGSVNNPPGYVPEQAWNDDEEIAQYCQANASNTFCTEGGNPAVSGWVAITNQQQAQQDLALVSGNGISASGGGPSKCTVQNSTGCVSGFTQPSWQTVTITGQASARFTPDVSFLASPNFPGYVFCTELSELGDSGTGSSCASGIATAVTTYSSIIGGTSVSAPLFAGIVALLNQSLSSSSGLGNVNPMLYQLAADTSNGAFHQVTSGTNTVYCTAGDPGFTTETSLNCPSTGILGYNASTDDATTGYNLVTGLGSVDVSNLATAWAATVAANFSLTSSTTPTSVAAGSTTTATITVAPASGFTGSVTLSCSGLPSGITCGSFTPSSVSLASGSATATVTISTAPNVVAGPATVTVKGTASGSGSTTTTVNFTVTATTETYCLSSNLVSGCSPSTPPSISVKQGAPAKVNLTVNSTNGFLTPPPNTDTVLPVTYSYTESPTVPLSNLTFSPASPNQSATVSITVTTTASTTAQARPLDSGTRVLYAALLPGLFGIMFIAGSRRRSLRGMRMLGLIMVLGASTFWLGSCGGSNNTSTGTPGTPPGNYTITVNSTTGGSAPLTGSYQFTLTVTQ